MLWSVAFERLGVVVSDIYFQDPDPIAGQEGPERGVRLELRMVEQDPLHGSIYSAVPLRIDRPLWRVDLLESVSSAPGSLDRAHHHPRFRRWEPGPRVFPDDLRADPVGWLAGQLGAAEDVLRRAGVEPGSLGTRDVAGLVAAAPLVVAAVQSLLREVAAGRAGLAPDATADSIRSSWL